MRLKKVFAGTLAAAMLVCAVAVPAFAAEEVEQENGQSSDRKSTRLNSSHVL